MEDFHSSLSKWFSERPKWLQVTAIKILNQGELSPHEISDLVTLCQQEVKGELTEMSCIFPETAFLQNTTGSLRLCSISNVQGVNALSPRKPLEFSKKNLTIVYGNNGSGKSGYVRLFKHITGTRQSGTLHPNIYKSKSIQKATITYEKDGIEKSYDWTPQNICDEVKGINIFDTSVGKIFVGIEDELSYEPPLLSFFSALTNICENVAELLDLQIRQYQAKRFYMPVEYKFTPEYAWYEKINAQTTLEEIMEHCSFIEKDRVDLQILQNRLIEQSPIEKARQFRKEKLHIDNLIEDINNYLKQLSDENLQKIIEFRKEVFLKKSLASADAQKIFNGSHLEGIGSDLWKKLWEAARIYSVNLAYQKSDYPNVSDGSHCVLCHQTITLETKERLISFEKFAKGEMQKESKEAVQRYESSMLFFDNISTSDLLETKIDAAGIRDEEIKKQIIDFYSQLQVLKRQILTEDEQINLTPLKVPEWLNRLKKLSKDINELAEKYELDAKENNFDEIKKNLNELSVRKWLSEQREIIKEEVSQLKFLNQLQESRKLTNTYSLSQKKGELSEKLITEEFVKRFNNELETLGANKIRVELIKSKVSKGRVLHKLQLRGAPNNHPEHILSEGENRIVSIAAFLADTIGKNAINPFIFDDPVSSLDQNYEELIAQRLCVLSVDRQVIIFTHRLSLLNLLQDHAKKINCELDIVCIREESWGTGEPGDTPLFAKKPDKVLGVLLNDRLLKAKKVLEEDGREEYEIIAGGLCKDFRILVEKMIECELLSDVVQRHRRAINTLGKIENLAKITKDDCEYFDSLMTKYSRYEHSQSLESPVLFPEPDELERDFKNLQQWQKEFKERPIA